MGRKNGCTFPLGKWVVEIMSRVSTPEAPIWIRIKGLTKATLATDADTEEGSSADTGWKEPYTTKRGATVDLEGKPVFDAVTGVKDPGQAELDYYARQVGCPDADARIRMIDPYGHATAFDINVTGTSNDVDETTSTASWSTTVVGEPEELPYVQALAVQITDAGAPATTLALEQGDVHALSVAFTPADASNQKYSVASSDASKVQVSNVDGLTFDVTGVAKTDTPVTLRVKTMNNNLIAEVAVTVTVPTP